MPEDIQIRAPKGRLTSLDALRGLAACAVVLWHCYLTIPELRRNEIDGHIWAKLARPLYNGDAAVFIFFILSGYVLALPYLRGTQLPYPLYVVRRVCRIYIPFAVSILFALLLYGCASRQSVAGASEWFNTLWPVTWPSSRALTGHFLMIGTEPDMTMNPIMWTLVHEMRISILFPLLILLCRDTRFAIAAIIVTLVVAAKILLAVGPYQHWTNLAGISASLVRTVSIIPYFMTGILLAKHRSQLQALWDRTPRFIRLGLFVMSVAIFMVKNDWLNAKIDVLYDLGVAILIVLTIESDKLRGFLAAPVPQWLGRISYSVYLTHMPIMLVTVPLLIGRLPFGIVTATVMAACLSVATLMHNLVEAPAIELGRRLTARSTAAPAPALQLAAERPE